jgi:hypothetical protein
MAPMPCAHRALRNPAVPRPRTALLGGMVCQVAILGREPAVAQLCGEQQVGIAVVEVSSFANGGTPASRGSTTLNPAIRSINLA